MTDKLELKSSHEVIDTVDVADVESIFYCKPTDPDILTVLMKDGKRLYCDEVCPVDSMQEEPKPLFNVGDIIRNKQWKTAIHKIVSMDDKAYYLENEGKIEIAHQGLWEVVGEHVNNNLQEVPCDHCQGFNDKEKCDELVFGHKCPSIKKPVNEDLEEAARNAATWHSRTKGDVFIANDYYKFIAGAKWQKERLWKDAQGDDLPEIDREVIAILNNGKVVFAHRPYKGKYIGKNLTTGNIETFENKVYDKGGWNQPDVKYWLNVELPKEIEV